MLNQTSLAVDLLLLHLSQRRVHIKALLLNSSDEIIGERSSALNDRIVAERVIGYALFLCVQGRLRINMNAMRSTDG